MLEVWISPQQLLELSALSTLHRTITVVLLHALLFRQLLATMDAFPLLYHFGFLVEFAGLFLVDVLVPRVHGEEKLGSWELDPLMLIDAPLSLSPGFSQLLFLMVDGCHQLLDALSIGDGLSLESHYLGILFFYAFLISNSVSCSLDPPLRKSLFIHLALFLFSLLFLLQFRLAGFHLLDDLTLEMQGHAPYIVLLRVRPCWISI